MDTINPKPFSNPNRLETDYSEPFNAWKKAPTPETTGALLRSVDKDIERGIAAHVGQSNPMLKSQAKRLAIQAMGSYDPTRARLGTHIVNHLQGLKRIARKQNEILSVPERVVLDQHYVHQHEVELTDELGRSPTMSELADRTGLSTKRIVHVRSYRPAMAEGTLMGQSEQSDENAEFQPAVDHDSTAWQQAVYFDLDNVNKKIMEMTLGLDGNKPLSNQQVAVRLKLSPGAISQRKAYIQSLLDQQNTLSPF